MPRPRRFKKDTGRTYKSPLGAIDEESSSDDDTVASSPEILHAGTDESPTDTSSARSTMPASPVLSPEDEHKLDKLKSKSRHILEKIERRTNFIQSRDKISIDQVKAIIEVQLQKIDRTTDIAAMRNIKRFLEKRFDRIELEYKVYKKLNHISKFKDSKEFVKEQTIILDELTTDESYNEAALKLKVSEYSECLKNKTLSLLETIKDLYKKHGKNTDKLSAIGTAIDTMSDEYLVFTSKDLQRKITHLNPSVEAGAEIASSASRNSARLFSRQIREIRGEELPEAKAKDDELPTPPESTSGHSPK